MFLLLDKLINWLEKHQQICPYKENLGIDCFGCGLQRAFILLLKGNIWDSIKLYPGLIPIIILFILFVLQFSFKSKILFRLLKIWFIFTSVLIIINYIFKLITF